MLVSSAVVQAAPITVTPSSPTPSCTGPGTGPDPSWITTYCPSMGGLTQYYKQNVGGAEEGSLAGSYTSVFTGASGDESGGTITWDGPAAIDCPTCWLMVKDGSATPGRYAFDLSSIWDGRSTITLSGFWAGTSGAISHWALYGKDICRVDCGPDRDLPTPGTLALVGLALAAVGAISRRRRIK